GVEPGGAETGGGELGGAELGVVERGGVELGGVRGCVVGGAVTVVDGGAMVVGVVGGGSPDAATGGASDAATTATRTIPARPDLNIGIPLGIRATDLQRSPRYPGSVCRIQPVYQLLGTWLQGRSLSARGSPGRPSTLSPRMFFMMFVVPPSMELAWTR